jgi:secreted PhoX family phosphatase
MSHDVNYEGHQGQEDIDISNPSQNETFESILQAYMSRRTLLKGAMASLALAYGNPLLRSTAKAAGMGFVPLAHSTQLSALLSHAQSQP